MPTPISADEASKGTSIPFAKIQIIWIMQVKTKKNERENHNKHSIIYAHKDSKASPKQMHPKASRTPNMAFGRMFTGFA